jgi:hypothetical protein
VPKAAAAQLDLEGEKGIRWRRTGEGIGTPEVGLGFRANKFVVVNDVISLVL